MSVREKITSDKIVIGASITSISVSIMCAIAIGYKSSQMKTSAHEYKSPAMNKSFEWCLPCNVLANRSNSDLLEKMDKTLKEGVQHCCAKNSEQSTSLFELVAATAQPEVRETFNQDSFAFSKASAHSQLTQTTLRSKEEPVFDDDNTPLEFEVTLKLPLIDHARNITLERNVMTVEIPGYYYVYSGIFFQPDSSRPCKEFPKQIWDHNIVLTRSKDSSEVIFNSTYTCCDECRKHKKTTYAGGLIQLQKNDRLHVEVSSDGVVSFRKEGSYFGLFMLA